MKLGITKKTENKHIAPNTEQNNTFRTQNDAKTLNKSLYLVRV